jgi:hypothetical protein
MEISQKVGERFIAWASRDRDCMTLDFLRAAGGGEGGVYVCAGGGSQ